MIKAFDIKSNEVPSFITPGPPLRIPRLEQVQPRHRKILKLQKNRYSLRPRPHWVLQRSQNPPTMLHPTSVQLSLIPAWKSTPSVSPFSTTPRNASSKVFSIDNKLGDSHIWNCKEEINEFLFCQQKPTDYVEFLQLSTPQQRLPKRYDFVLNEARYDWNWSFVSYITIIILFRIHLV